MLSRATRYLHIVPLELWLACWALCSLQQLRRLSLVCKLFRSLVIPHLFESDPRGAPPLRGSLGPRFAWSAVCI
ncbi:hypothetical protein B0H14DRAFT_2724719 [Mycena olivaceomarginata]|nr:hypothetical protein B0H14DRAFT_2724719 [Mycena olivaceomarginata]